MADRGSKFQPLTPQPLTTITSILYYQPLIRIDDLETLALLLEWTLWYSQ
jgi:hypothetical protein